MLAAERQAHILDEVRRRGVVKVNELAGQFRVSDMTIRRDLDVLVTRGALDKVHGGATSRSGPSSEEPGFDAKVHRQLAEKEAIAQRAATLVAPGSAVGLSAGTTTWAMASHLRNISDLTVVTNSIRIADALRTDHEGAANVILTGGVRTPSDALVGPLAVAALSQLHLDVVFLGVHGIAATAGFTTPNLLEADTNKALVAAGQRLIVVADHTKWGTIGLSTIAALDQADTLISDDGLASTARETLSEHITNVVITTVR